jgi:hypothetical protein
MKLAPIDTTLTPKENHPATFSEDDEEGVVMKEGRKEGKGAGCLHL